MAAPRIFCGTVTGQLMTLGGTGEGITPPVVSIARRQSFSRDHRGQETTGRDGPLRAVSRRAGHRVRSGV